MVVSIPGQTKITFRYVLFSYKKFRLDRKTGIHSTLWCDFDESGESGDSGESCNFGETGDSGNSGESGKFCDSGESGDPG